MPRRSSSKSLPSERFNLFLKVSSQWQLTIEFYWKEHRFLSEFSLRVLDDMGFTVTRPKLALPLDLSSKPLGGWDDDS
jgi:hypothetical protein